MGAGFPFKGMLLTALIISGTMTLASFYVDYIVSNEASLSSSSAIPAQAKKALRVMPSPEISSSQADLTHRSLQDLLVKVGKLNCAIQSFPKCQATVGLVPQVTLNYPAGGLPTDLYKVDSAALKSDSSSYNQQIQAMLAQGECLGALTLARSTTACGREPASADFATMGQ